MMFVYLFLGLTMYIKKCLRAYLLASFFFFLIHSDHVMMFDFLSNLSLITEKMVSRTFFHLCFFLYSSVAAICILIVILLFSYFSPSVFFVLIIHIKKQKKRICLTSFIAFCVFFCSPFLSLSFAFSNRSFFLSFLLSGFFDLESHFNKNEKY